MNISRDKLMFSIQNATYLSARPPCSQAAEDKKSHTLATNNNFAGGCTRYIFLVSVLSTKPYAPSISGESRNGFCPNRTPYC